MEGPAAGPGSYMPAHAMAGASSEKVSRVLVLVMQGGAFTVWYLSVVDLIPSRVELVPLSSSIARLGAGSLDRCSHRHRYRFLGTRSCAGTCNDVRI